VGSLHYRAARGSFGPVRRYANRVLLRYDRSPNRSIDVIQYIERARSHVLQKPMPFDRRTFVTEQFFARSSDGTRVPYFVTHRKRHCLRQVYSTILYGNGAFRYLAVTGVYDLCVLWVAHAVRMRSKTVAAEVSTARRGTLRPPDAQAAFVRRLLRSRSSPRRERITSLTGLESNGISGGGLLVGALRSSIPETLWGGRPQSRALRLLRYQLPGESAGYPRTVEHGVCGWISSARGVFALSQRARRSTLPATLVLAEAEDDRVDRRTRTSSWPRPARASISGADPFST